MMNFLFTLPFAFFTKELEQIFSLDDQGVLTVDTGRSSDKKQVATECVAFRAAADQHGAIHLLITGQQQQLTYCMLENNEVRTLPFIITKAPDYFSLAFGPNGIGYYCGQDEGKLTIAVLHASQRWEHSELKLGTKPMPVYLTIDQIGYAHLLLYDAVDACLWYVTIDRHECSTPIQLAQNLKLNALPALLLDSVQNIHVAWVGANDNRLYYRVRLAGGWPAGGWQKVRSLPISSSPRCLSFTDQYPHPQLWLLDDTKLIHSFDTGDLKEPKQSPFTDNQMLIRTGGRTANVLQVVTIQPDASLWESLSQLEKEARLTRQSSFPEEEDSLIFLHVRRLLSEKKRLEYELSKKEASLSQLRNMLELSQENVKKQNILLNEKMSVFNTKLRELQQKNSELETKSRQLPGYEEQLIKNQKRLAVAEASSSELKQQVAQLKNELANVLAREKGHLHQIKKLEEEMAAKKGMWDTISGMFQKKTFKKK